MRKALLIAALGLLLGTASTGCSEQRTWQAFVYPDGIENATSSEAVVEAAGPIFASQGECLSWAAQEAASYPNGGYECAYNCEYRVFFEDNPELRYAEIICEGR